MSDITPPPAPPDPRVWRQPEFKRGRQYTIEADFSPLLLGEALLPNFEPIPHHMALHYSIGLYGRTIERVQVPGRSYDQRVKAHIGVDVGADKPKLIKGDAIYYLNCGQGGGYTGEGVVVLDTYGYGRTGPESIITGKFTFCRHEKVEGAGANHSRGWHPGYCGKCGLDMSVDSGD